MSKRVLVATSSTRDARFYVLHLSQILRDTSTIEHSVRGNILRTECVTVEFVLRKRCLDGLACDVPIGFNPEQSRRMTRGNKYPELKNLKDIAKYIIEEELK